MLLLTQSETQETNLRGLSVFQTTQFLGTTLGAHVG